MIASFSLMMGVSSLFALFIGMFIIYNSFAIAVTERRSEIGILRALGATRDADPLDVPRRGCGDRRHRVGRRRGGRHPASRAASTPRSPRWSARSSASHRRRWRRDRQSGRCCCAALGIGIATSIVAALVPARMAARVEPVQALQKGTYHALSVAREPDARVVLAVAVPRVDRRSMAWRLGDRARSFYASYLLAIAAVLCSSPLLSLGLARLLRPVLKRVCPVEGALAADSLIQAPRRTSATRGGADAARSRSSWPSRGWRGPATGRSSTGSTRWSIPTCSSCRHRASSMRTMRFPATMGGRAGMRCPASRRDPISARSPVPFRQTPVMVLALDLLSIQRPTRSASGRRRS